MTNESEHTTGSHPVGDTGEIADGAGTAETVETVQTVAPAGSGQSAGWGGSSVVHDHSGQPAGDSGWDADRVIRDEGGTGQPGADTGWSGAEVVKDHGDMAERQGGWSGDEVVKDHGERDDPLV